MGMFLLYRGKDRSSSYMAPVPALYHTTFQAARRLTIPLRSFINTQQNCRIGPFSTGRPRSLSRGGQRMCLRNERFVCHRAVP